MSGTNSVHSPFPIGQDEAAKARLLALHRGSTKDITRPVTQIVRSHTAEAPDRCAVIDEDGRPVSYAQLFRRALQVSALVAAYGCQKDDVIAVCGPRCSDVVAAYLGIELGQMVYVPLDERWPAQRLHELLADSGATALLGVAPPDRVAEAARAAGIPAIALSDLPAAAGEGTDAASVSTPDRISYLLYTSGSTGTPKGALIEQRGLLNHLWAKVDDLSLASDAAVAFTAPLTFDISLWQMLAALVAGGRVDVMSEAATQDPRLLVGRLAECGSTVVELVPTMLRLVLDELERLAPWARLPALRQLISTGEELPPALAERCLNVLGHVRLINAYGPTECSDDVTHHIVAHMAPAALRVPIGGPIPNTSLYVLRAEGDMWEACAAGEAGELFVGGHGVGRGYLADPERTAAAFFADPFDSLSATGRLYRTGDTVRVTATGELEYLGRVDRQVKIAGVRVELGEIEAVLLRHPDVAACAVVRHLERAALVSRESTLAKDSFAPLVCYYVAPTVPQETLRRYLEDRLPAAVVPRRWAALPRLPLTANGKVDHAALPAPRPTAARRDDTYRAPEGDREILVTGLAARFLGFDRLGAETSFVGSGGDSLQAMRLTAALRDAGHDVSIRTVLTADTLGGLARALRPAGQEEPAAAPAGHTGRRLTPEQEGVYFQWRLRPQDPYYSYQGVLQIDGPVCWDRVKSAWDRLLAENPNLLARITDGPAGPVQDFPIWSVRLGEPVDLCGLPEPRREQALRDAAEAEAERPFDLGAEPILRAEGYRLGTEDHRLLLTMHEVLLDGWGATVLFQRMAELYRRDDGPREARYEQYLLHHQRRLRRPRTAAAAGYWRAVLSGDLPVLDLPRRADQPAHPSHKGRVVERALDGDRYRALDVVCQSTGCTSFMVLLAAYALSLGCYAGTEAVIIGAPIANRHDPGAIDVPTFALNMVPLRIEMPPDRTLGAHLEEVRRVVTGALDAAEYPFGWMLKMAKVPRGTARTPVFQTMLNMLTYPAEQIDVEGARWVFTELDTGFTKYDCALYVQRHGTQAMVVQLSYLTDLLSVRTAEGILDGTLIALDRLAAADDALLCDVDLLSSAHHARLDRLGSGSDRVLY